MSNLVASYSLFFYVINQIVYIRIIIISNILQDASSFLLILYFTYNLLTCYIQVTLIPFLDFFVHFGYEIFFPVHYIMSSIPQFCYDMRVRTMCALYNIYILEILDRRGHLMPVQSCANIRLNVQNFSSSYFGTLEKRCNVEL